MKSGLQHSSSVHLATFESTITKYLLCAIEVISDKVSRNKDYQASECPKYLLALCKRLQLLKVIFYFWSIDNHTK